jgi:hypothetical protein
MTVPQRFSKAAGLGSRLYLQIWCRRCPTDKEKTSEESGKLGWSVNPAARQAAMK